MTRVLISGFAGWVRVVSTLAVVLAAGIAAGRWLLPPPRASSAPAAAVSPARAAGGVWYTCGMHPQVLQREPGICPICEMRLTPTNGEDADAATAAAGPQERKVRYWRSPMHPDFTSDGPGKDFMGHDLVPVYADEGEVVGGQLIRIDPVTVQNMGIRTERVRTGPLVRTIRTVGRVDYDEQKLVYVDTKFSGWIEKLYVNESGQKVQSGDPLFDVYSPDLYSAQVEFISAVRKLPLLEQSAFADAAEDARRMVDAARLKLEYFDVPAAQIDRIQKSLTPEKTLQIHAPADGIVAEKMAVEGMRVMPGMRLFTIADLARVWAYVDIYEYQLPWVHVGQTATMTLPYIPDKVFRGAVTYIYPYLQRETRVIKVRLEFENPTLELKPDMYANVVLEGLLREQALLIPREGFIDSGPRKVAFVDRGGGKFEPRDIRVGVEGEGGYVEVLAGLQAGDTVVTSGQFLLDSESKLQEAVAKMREPMRHTPRVAARAGYNSARVAAVTPPTSAPTQAGGANVAYTCPKHEHVLSDSPGDCPVCSARLEPFRAMYSCRNPRHARQTSSQPDDCPECGEPLAMYRGPWVSPPMIAVNPPPASGPASSGPSVVVAETGRGIPPDARYACPMQECWQFSATEGRCRTCGMKLKPLESVEWAAALSAPAPATAGYVCPMHPDRVRRAEPGVCPICAMQLVPPDKVIGLEQGAASVAAQIDFLMEHYLGLSEQLAGDRTTDVARHALGLVDAAETLRDHLARAAAADGAALRDAAERIHLSALKVRGLDLDDDRAQFAAISAAMRVMIGKVRPSPARWPKLYVYHCPMSRADWIQAVEKKANPYYGFKMLDCGNLVDTK